MTACVVYLENDRPVAEIIEKESYEMDAVNNRRVQNMIIWWERKHI